MVYLFYLIVIIFIISKYSNCENWEHGIEQLEVPPFVTDSEILEWNEPHIITIGKNKPTSNLLHVHLPGENSLPSNEMFIIKEIALLGYPSIGLRYPNSWSLQDLCGNDGLCFGKIRQEIQFGDNLSDKVNINFSNSLQNRLIKLLIYLSQTRNSTEGWNTFLKKDCTECPYYITWNTVIVSGHGDGGSQAAFIASNFSVARVVMLSSPLDFINNLPVPWEGTHQTPSNRYFGFVHSRETACFGILKIWNIFDMNKFGWIADGPSREFPFLNTHQLCSSLNPIFGFAFHESTGIDSATPITNGVPTYLPIWKYLLMTGNCTEDCAAQNGSCLSTDVCFDGPFFFGNECTCSPCIETNFNLIFAVLFTETFMISCVDILVLLWLLRKGFNGIFGGILIVFLCIFNSIYCLAAANMLQYGWGPSNFGSLCNDKTEHIISVSVGVICLWEGIKGVTALVIACLCVLRRQKKSQGYTRISSVKTTSLG